MRIYGAPRPHAARHLTTRCGASEREIKAAQDGLLMAPQLLFFDGSIKSKSNSLLTKELPDNIDLISIQNHFENNSILVRFEHKIQTPDDNTDAVSMQLGYN